MPSPLLGVVVLSLRWLPLLLWLPGVGWAARLLSWGLCTLYTASLGLDRLPQSAPALDALGWAIPAAHELAMGLLILLGVASLWAALQSAARLVGYSLMLPDGELDIAGPMGLSASLSRAFAWCGTALFFAAGGLDRLVALMATSYELLPLPGSGQEPAPFSFGASQLAAVGGRLFALLFVLALPVLAPRLLAEAALALALRSGLSGASSPTAQAAIRPLRPVLWLICLVLSGGAILTLWLQQGPALLHMLLSPASTQRP